jgi:hypothetical protein
LAVARLPETKSCFLLLSRRWVVERSLARGTRCPPALKDYRRLLSILASLHVAPSHAQDMPPN